MVWWGVPIPESLVLHVSVLAGSATDLQACMTSWCGAALQAREEKPIRTTLQLANLIGGPTRRPSSKHRRPGSRTIHPATRVFQVLSRCRL